VRNRRITPFKLVTGSNLADVGRARCFPAGQVKRQGSSGLVLLAGLGGHGEGLRRTCGDAAGAELGSSFGKRTAVNTGTTPPRFPAGARPARVPG
jgi:hypothetical protein